MFAATKKVCTFASRKRAYNLGVRCLGTILWWYIIGNVPVHSVQQAAPGFKDFPTVHLPKRSPLLKYCPTRRYSTSRGGLRSLQKGPQSSSASVKPPMVSIRYRVVGPMCRKSNSDTCGSYARQKREACLLHPGMDEPAMRCTQKDSTPS